MPDATCRITVTMNLDEIGHPRPFDVLEAEKAGAVTLVDPCNDDEDGGGLKDLLAEWPTRRAAGGREMTFATWWSTYALPMLAQGGRLGVLVEGKGVAAGLSQSYRGDTPRPWVRVDTTALTGEVGEKLARIRAIVEGRS